jgi:hypothetical protein
MQLAIGGGAGDAIYRPACDSIYTFLSDGSPGVLCGGHPFFDISDLSEKYKYIEKSH